MADEGSQSATIKNLQPKTTYSISLSASNDIGTSSSSKTINVTTKVDRKYHSHHPNFQGAANIAKISPRLFRILKPLLSFVRNDITRNVTTLASVLSFSPFGLGIALMKSYLSIRNLRFSILLIRTGMEFKPLAGSLYTFKWYTPLPYNKLIQIINETHIFKIYLNQN